MSNLKKRKLHGPIATLRTETAIWDGDLQDWQPSPHLTIISFHPDGKTSTSDTHNPGGSIAHARYLYDDAGRLTERHTWMNDECIHRTSYFYDEAGRHIRTAGINPDGSQVDSETSTYDADGKMTKVIFLHLPDRVSDREKDGGLVAHSAGHSIEGLDMHFSAPGTDRIITAYDKESLPAKVIFQNQYHEPLKEVLFERDASGRTLSIDILIGESQFKDLVDRVPADSREAMAAVLRQAFGPSFSRITYTYDSWNRLLERTHTMGTLKEDRTTYRYDNLHDEPIEEISEDTSRTANIDEDGAIHYESDKKTVQHNRFEYIYDAQGNWTERIVSYRVEPDADFLRSSIERRTITYHAA